jgi:osmotically inducible protein OsmC
MATTRRAEVTWQGDLPTGAGTIEKVTSGVISSLGVSWPARIGEDQSLTSPEELIAAAHASCFSMALSNILAKDGTTPENLSVAATVTFVPGEGIESSALEVTGRVPGIDEEGFAEAAEKAKENCPVSQALQGNVEISVEARLAS